LSVVPGIGRGAHRSVTIGSGLALLLALLVGAACAALTGNKSVSFCRDSHRPVCVWLKDPGPVTPEWYVVRFDGLPRDPTIVITWGCFSWRDSVRGQFLDPSSPLTGPAGSDGPPWCFPAERDDPATGQVAVRIVTTNPNQYHLYGYLEYTHEGIEKRHRLESSVSLIVH
jgi:hypothetical protein